MSWQSYLEKLIKTGKVSKAAIFGFDGSVWAITPGYAPSTEEVKTLIENLSSLESQQAKGVVLEGLKYTVFSYSDTSAYLRKGNTGATVVKTEKTILIGHFDGTMQPDSSTPVVEALGDYIRNLGY
ncbi:profilin, required for normal timing of actin polymerization in response to thermal stress [Lunasporangiospora selenospora]|uniref:Profilin n=1 Tax=Lunasporangiospora selenospora TaxID=979761 RepID=A0A9P6KDN2_9FUNG|nr:profilin, required for normal timing of actin polymerization in response to thermal stress [Lunasporangiospora selenospora]